MTTHPPTLPPLPAFPSGQGFCGSPSWGSVRHHGRDAEPFPAIAQEYFKLNPAQIGLIMLASAVVIVVADQGSRTLVLTIRGFANIISSLRYLVFPSFWGVGASKLVDDTGKAAFRPAWGSVMAQVANEQPHRRARVMAFIDVGEDAGDAAGPILAGWLLVLGGLPLMLGVQCGLAAITEVWTWWTTHRRDPRSPGVPDVTSEVTPDRPPHLLGVDTAGA